MEKQELESKVIFIFADKLGFDTSEITKDSHLNNDLGMDSFDKIEVLMECEKEFDMSISDEEAEKITTVGESIELINSLIKS